MPKTLPIKIQEREDRTGERNSFVRGRRGKRWKNARQVGQKDENSDRSNERNVALRVVGHILFDQVSDAKPQRISDQELRNLLQRSGLFDRKLGAQNERDDGGQNQNDQPHHYMLGDGQLRMLRLNVQCREQCQRGPAEVVIHDLRDPTDVFFHLAQATPTGLRSTIQRTYKFVKARRDSRGPQSTQTQQHAQKGNLQDFKNNTHAQGYQGVAKRGEKVS
jgi:hypothetical protein